MSLPNYSCPDGGAFYICEGAWVEFFCCCTSDPCVNGAGKCPDGNLRAAELDFNDLVNIPDVFCSASKSFDFFGNCPGFIGCCKESPCQGKGCPKGKLIPAELAGYYSGKRLDSGTGGGRASRPHHPTSVATPLPAPTFTGLSHGTDGNTDDERVPSSGAVAGISVGAMLVILIVLGLLWIYWPARKLRNVRSTNPYRLSKVSYAPISSALLLSAFHDPKAQSSAAPDATTSDDTTNVWHGGPQELHPKSFGWYAGLIWDILLTLAAALFIVLPVLALRLEGQEHSDYGRSVLELTRLSPTIYPILFATVASRFYKNIARWCLEQRNGISLASLEQTFGSQSLAGALERLFSVRAQVPIGIVILLTWTLSPLGGQSASRLLSTWGSSTITNRTIYYANPSYQMSYFLVSSFAAATKANVIALYSSSLISSPEQRRSSRDLWGLPKIPQWVEGRADKMYDVDERSLYNGDAHYSSLLGVKVQGLEFASDTSQFDFSIETSYIDFNCSFEGVFASIISDPLENINTDLFKSFPIDITINNSELWGRWNSSHNPPPIQMVYTSLTVPSIFPKSFDASVFKCDMRNVILETEIRCGPTPLATSCSARRQRRVNRPDKASRLPAHMLSSPVGLQNGLRLWREAAGPTKQDTASPTDNYIVGELTPYSGQTLRTWSSGSPPNVTNFSKRLTTAFNTFWEDTLFPFSHTTVSFNTPTQFSQMSEIVPNGQPFLNSTQGTMTTKHDVYCASRTWTYLLLVATLILEILAIVGFILRFFIHGPDVLGFVSSMTRDNPYTPLHRGGSGLNGPDRARRLRHLRVQLADLQPQNDIGYIGLRTVPWVDLMEQQLQKDETSLKWRSFGRKRTYL